jgi:hypothetical protein
MNTSKKVKEIDFQAQVLIMAFQSLDNQSRENFLEFLKQEIEDEEFFDLLKQRAKTSKVLTNSESKNIRNYLKSV